MTVVAIAGRDPVAVQAVHRTLTAGGLDTILLPADRSLFDEVQRQAPDLVALLWSGDPSSDPLDAQDDRLFLWQLAAGVATRLLVITRDHDPDCNARTLDAGADDVCALSAGTDVIGARVRALLRRRPGVAPAALERRTIAEPAVIRPVHIVCPGSTIDDLHWVIAGASVCEACGRSQPVGRRE